MNDKRDLTGPFDVIGDVHGCPGSSRNYSPSWVTSQHLGAFAIPMAGPRCLSATSSIAARTRRACCGW